VNINLLITAVSACDGCDDDDDDDDDYDDDADRAVLRPSDDVQSDFTHG